MDNLNFKLANLETQLDKLFNGLPVGVVYFILKSKLSEVETLYYEQAQKEYAVVVQKQPQDQATQENEPETA